MKTTEPDIIWKKTDDGIKAFTVDKRGREVEAVWAPQPGSQEMFLKCPVYEVLYEGTRGPGKTDALLMDFAQEVGKGWGEDWVGILFRLTFPQLRDVIDKSKKWFPRMFPGAKFIESGTPHWRFPDGEKLIFSYMSKPSDYDNYHGHAYPWIAFEELTRWSTPECYTRMMSCSRSSRKGIPIRVRATTNPYGIGHNWVKERFRLPCKPRHIIGPVIRDDIDEETGRPLPTRGAIHGELSENKILLDADPEYVNKLVGAARNEAELRAWLYGDWDITAGGMFDDLWPTIRHKAVIPRFQVPKSWRIDRAFDWGSSKPFSVGWWAESDGSDYKDANGKWRSSRPGDLFRIGEWYGCSGPNEGVKMIARDIAKGIVEREVAMGIHERVQPGPADNSIFDQDASGVDSVASKMEEEVRLDDGAEYPGVEWERSDKRAGSRKLGWEAMRTRLKALDTEGPREEPAIFVFDTCEHWLRTVPTLPRSDKDPDDVDTDAEDHIGDETRYRVRFDPPVVGSSRVDGMI